MVSQNASFLLKTLCIFSEIMDNLEQNEASGEDSVGCLRWVQLVFRGKLEEVNSGSWWWAFNLRIGFMLGGSLHVCSLSRGLISFIRQVSGCMFVIVYQ